MLTRRRGDRTSHGLVALLLAALAGALSAGPARADPLCTTAEMLIAIEIAAQELDRAPVDKAPDLVGRISSSLEFTDWEAGVAALPENARRMARGAVESFVASRRAMVAAYREEGLAAARAVMATPDYLPHSRIIDVVEQLADCVPPVTVESVRGGHAQYLLHGRPTGTPTPTTAGEPSMLFFWVNVLFVVAALVIGRQVERFLSRRARQQVISYETALRDGPAQLGVTLVSITGQEARMAVPEALEPGAAVALCLGGTWHAGTVGFSTMTFAMVTFAPPLPGRVVRRTRLLGAAPTPVAA